MSQNVSVLLGQPGGGYVPDPAGAPSAAGAGAVAAADVNGDGRPDLLVPDYNSGGVTVLLGQAGGGFAFESKPATGLNPRALALADFNGDGRPDMAVINRGSDSVTILLRQPLGGFAAPGAAIPVGSHPSGIVAADLNGDGLPDLGVANYTSGNVSLLLNAGGAGFVPDPASPLATGPSTLGIAAGDFDGDGRTDLAITNHDSNLLYVLLRRPGGGYAPDSSSPIGLPVGPSGVAAGDLDGDGHPDLAVASDQANTVSVLLDRPPTPAGNTTVTNPPVPPTLKPPPTFTVTIPSLSPGNFGFPSAGGGVSAALKKALAKVDLEAQMAAASAKAKVTKQGSDVSGAAKPGLEERLESFSYGIPVVVHGTKGSYVEISAALAIAAKEGQKGSITTAGLPPTVVQLTGPTTTVQVPIEGQLTALLKAKQDKEAARKAVEAAVTVAGKELVQEQLDSLSELSQLEQQRLQLAMDRSSKMLEVLNNVIHQINETTGAIAGNLKRPATKAPSLAQLRARAAKLTKQANAQSHLAAALLAPAIRAHPGKTPRATFAVKPCGKRCPLPSFGGR